MMIEFFFENCEDKRSRNFQSLVKHINNYLKEHPDLELNKIEHCDPKGTDVYALVSFKENESKIKPLEGLVQALTAKVEEQRLEIERLEKAQKPSNEVVEDAASADMVLCNWDPDHITACEPSAEQYRVYRVHPCDCAYVGYSLVAANSVEDANRIIQDFKNSDPHNDRDSYAYGDVSESNLIEDLISTREGIILEGFYYTGN